MIPQQEETLLKKLLNIEEFNEFCKTHKVEVVLDSSLNYLCYIDYKKGDRAYGDSLFNPLLAMVLAVKEYKKQSPPMN
jgi:hypothetical protein